MRKHRIGYSVVTLLALIIYIFANSKEALIFLMALVVMFIASMVLEAVSVNTLKIHINIKESCYIKQKLPLSIEVEGRRKLPTGAIKVRVIIENILFGESRECILMLQPTSKRHIRYNYPIAIRDCGDTKITIKEIEVYDMLGVVAWKKEKNIESRVLVYPERLKLSVRLSRNPVTQTFGELYDQTRKGQDVSEVFNLREYVAGDSVGSIHWKLSGKLDQLVVREFGYPSNYSTVIVYELMKKCNGRKISNDINDAVVALTSALSSSLLELNHTHNVGTVINGQFTTTPVNSMDRHNQMLLNALCSPIPSEEKKMDSMYYFLHSELKNDYTKVIYVTSEYNESYVKDLAKYMDITVVNIVEEKAEGYVEAQGYSVIPIDKEIYHGWIRNIEI